MSEPQDFDGRVALITGGTQGLGFAVAELLKARGASGLVLVGRDVAKGEAATEALGDGRCRTIFVAADLQEAAGCERAVHVTDEEFRTCHAVINFSAKTDRGTVWDSSP